MGRRADALTKKVNEGYLDWRRLVANPYIAAYDTAYNSYQSTVKAQDDADKARAELFVAAAGIVTGSVLMATVATSSMRVLLARQALTLICNNNMNRLFNGLHAASNSKAFMFAIGKLLDEGKSQINKVAGDAVTKLVTSNSTVIASTPLVQFVHLDTFLLNHRKCAVMAAEAVDASADLSEADKEWAFGKLNAAPIANSPAKGVDEVLFASRIELCFWMQLILDSDKLISWPAQSYGDSPMAGVVGAKSRSIDKMPRDPSYPRPTMPRPGLTGIPAHKSVGYTRPGSTIRERVDVVHDKVFGTPFYKDYGLFGWGEPDATNRRQELIAAQDVMTKLANRSRPESLLDVKIA